MEQNPFLEKRKKREEGRQAPEPEPEPGGTANHDGTRAFLARIENPIQLKSCLGKKREEWKQAPEPEPEPKRTRKS